MVIKIASANGGFGYYSLSSEEPTSTTASGTPSISNGDPIKSNQQTSQDLKLSIQADYATSKTMSASVGISTTRMDINSKSQANKPIKLRNFATGEVTLDTLHHKTASQPSSGQTCPEADSVCYGSLMKQTKEFFHDGNNTNESILAEAEHFFEQFFAATKQLRTSVHRERIAQIEAEIVTNGTYELKSEELLFGAKLAWRNASRCIGRIQWQKLQLFDMRQCSTAREMFDAVCNHIKYATNGGNLRSTITVFPQRLHGRKDYRLWNPQLIAYAGYEKHEENNENNAPQSKCPIKGDPANVEFTKICQKLGWKGSGSPWDILPIVISIPGQDPEWFSIPEELILRIPIVHPKFDWFERMDLQWYSLPAVANMKFEIGGIEFPACPFSGWYMDTEVAVRDLSDVQRYNILPLVAKHLGLDSTSNASLWKDRAVVEVNTAVLYSYQKAGVTIVDHYTASDQFMKHLENENRLRGGCPADWVWIVPPISGSMTPLFHQEMLNYELKPAYVYQEPAWKTHVWNRPIDAATQRGKANKLTFKTVAKVAQILSSLFAKALHKRVKATIVYATETGKSEQFAKRLSHIFSNAFNVLLLCADSYNPLERLSQEALLLIVTSTFGNGDAPENGESLSKQLHARTKLTFGGKFAVFALGSTAYPHFCAFGKNLDNLLAEMGGERILECGTGDELAGQEHSFNQWAQQAFDQSCSSFGLTQNDQLKLLLQRQTSLLFQPTAWTKADVKLEEIFNDGSQIVEEKSKRIKSALTKLSHNKKIVPYKLIDREFLNETSSSSDGAEDQATIGHTIRVTLKIDEHTTSEEHSNYLPGDHLAVYPQNDSLLVSGIIDRLLEHDSTIDPDKLCSVKIRKSEDIWSSHDKLPEYVSLREALLRYLDIATPPSQQLLKVLLDSSAQHENENTDTVQFLKQLCEDSAEYENWKAQLYPNFLEVLNQFPWVKLCPELVFTQLPVLQPRYYSISCSPLTNSSSQLDLTIGLVQYMNADGVTHRGVCSNYLANLALGRTVFAFIRNAPNFHLPSDPQLPVIMIGPGTGIAPFRGFWQHRAALRRQQTPSGSVHSGEMSLFFGCRMPSMQLYRREIESLMKRENRVITDYHVAFSRKQGKPKRYVQDELRSVTRKIHHALVHKGGHIYVCGDVTMAEDVNHTLKAILSENGVPDPEKTILELKESNRYHEDIFGNIKQIRVADESKEMKALNREVTFTQKKKLFRFWKFC